MLVSVAYALGWLVYCLVDDVVSLPLRPMILLNHLFGVDHTQPGWLSSLSHALHQPSLMAHTIVCVTLLLVLVSIVALVPRFFERFPKLIHAACLTFFIDACAQIRSMVTVMLNVGGEPHSIESDASNYPLSHTALAPLLVQLPFAVVLWSPSKFNSLLKKCIPHYLCLVGAFSTHLASLSLPSSDSSLWFVSFLFQTLSYILLVCGLTPMIIRDYLLRICEKLLYLAQLVCSFTYIMIEKVWPPLVLWIRRILSSSFVNILYRWVLSPAWRIVAPWLMPIVLLTLALRLSSLQPFDSLMSVLKFDQLALFFAQIVCVVTSISSAIIMCLVALDRKVTIDTSPRFFKCMTAYARLIGLPWSLLIRLCSGRLTRLLGYVLRIFLERIFNFAIATPILAIPIVITSGVTLMYILVLSPHAQDSWIWIPWLLLNHVRQMSDTTLVLVLVAFVQTSTYHLCGVSILAPSIEASRYVSLPSEELRMLSESMDSPRRCRRCWFGPVSHAGCNNLQTHHGENGVSNACPRCGWFGYSLAEWPPWEDDDERDAAGHAIYARRAWEEFIMAIRASAKALVIPLTIMRIATYHLSLSPTLGALLSLSYLIPCIFENANLFGAIYQQIPITPTPTRQRQQQHQPFDQPDCGRANRTPPRVQYGSGDTFASILAEAAPDTIFIDDRCSVCLDEWSNDAVGTCRHNPPVEAAPLLRQLDPPCIALRCGHVLHLECTQDFVQANVGRYQRCPLCRQPMTLAGAISAGLFS